MEHTVNMNAAECIKQTNGMLASTYHNVCSGTHTEVPYGAADLILGYGASGFAVGAISVMAWLFFKMARS